MRELLMNIAPILVWILAVVELGLGVLCLIRSRKLLSVLSSAVCFGLAIDAFIISLGTVISEGELLQNLSQIRYILHGILVPLLIPISFHAFGIKHKWILIAVWVIAAVIIVAGVIMGVISETEPVTMAGILRYAQSESNTVFAKVMKRVLSFGGIIPLLVMGFAGLIKNKRPFILLAGVFMFAFAALAPATHNMDLNFLLSMIGEAFMVFFFYMEVLKISKK